MFELFIEARNVATLPAQHAMLEAIIHDDDRALGRLMDEEDHGELLPDVFFVPLMGLMASQASRDIWRVMGQYGYSMKSLVDEEGQTSLGEWAAKFLPLDRLNELMEEGLLDPFVKENGTAKLSVCEHGLLGGSDAHFDFWLDVWKTQYAKEFEKEVRYDTEFSLPRIFNTITGMLMWQKNDAHHTSYPDTFPKKQELERRLDRLVDAMLNARMPSMSLQAQWESVLAAPPSCYHKAGYTQADVFSSIIKRIETPWKDPDFLEKNKQAIQDNEGLLFAFLTCGAPIATQYGRQTLPLNLLNDILADREKEATWDAWLSRAKTDIPLTYEALPQELKNGSTSVGQYFSKHKKQSMQAIEMRLCLPEEKPAKPRACPRL